MAVHWCLNVLRIKAEESAPITRLSRDMTTPDIMGQWSLFILENVIGKCHICFVDIRSERIQDLRGM